MIHMFREIFPFVNRELFFRIFQEAFKGCQEKIEAMVELHKKSRQPHSDTENYKTAETDGDNDTDCWF